MHSESASIVSLPTFNTKKVADMIYERRSYCEVGQKVMFIGHSPPPEVGERTAQPLLLFLNHFGISNFVLTNLYSRIMCFRYQYKDWKVPLASCTDAINDKTLVNHAADADYIICAWGTTDLGDRVDWVKANLPNHKLFYLKVQDRPSIYHYEKWLPEYYPSCLSGLSPVVV